MEKRIVYTNDKGGVSQIIIPNGSKLTMKQIAKLSVPSGVDYRIITVDKLPQSRNWRDAWTDSNPEDTVSIDLEKAKIEHKKLIKRVCSLRYDIDEISTLDKKVEELDLSGVNTLDDLYNTWIDEFDVRNDRRVYSMHSTT